MALQLASAAITRLAGVARSANPTLLRLADSITNVGLYAYGSQKLMFGFTASLSDAVAKMGELNRSARALDVSNTELRRFADTAHALAGVNFGQSFDALETFAERVGEAYVDTGSEIANVFRRLGVDVADGSGGIRRATDVWRDFIAEIRRPAARAANRALQQRFAVDCHP